MGRDKPDFNAAISRSIFDIHYALNWLNAILQRIARSPDVPEAQVKSVGVFLAHCMACVVEQAELHYLEALAKSLNDVLKRLLPLLEHDASLIEHIRRDYAWAVDVITLRIIDCLSQLEPDLQCAHALFSVLCNLLRRADESIIFPINLRSFLTDQYDGPWPFPAHVDLLTGAVITREVIHQAPLIRAFTQRNLVYEIDYAKAIVSLKLSSIKHAIIKIPQAYLDLLGETQDLKLPINYLVSQAEMVKCLKSQCPFVHQGSIIMMSLSDVVAVNTADIWSDTNLWERSDCKRRIGRLLKIRVIKNYLTEQMGLQKKDNHGLQMNKRLGGLLERVCQLLNYHDCYHVDYERIIQAVRVYQAEQIKYQRHQVFKTRAQMVRAQLSWLLYEPVCSEVLRFIPDARNVSLWRADCQIIHQMAADLHLLELVMKQSCFITPLQETHIDRIRADVVFYAQRIAAASKKGYLASPVDTHYKDAPIYVPGLYGSIGSERNMFRRGALTERRPSALELGLDWTCKTMPRP